VFLLYSHACLSFFILQLTCISVTIVWRAWFQQRLPWCPICVSQVLFGCLLQWSCWHVFFIVLSCLLVIFIHSTAELELSFNSLTGTIPSRQLGLLTKLSKSSVVWLLVVMIVLSCVFHCTLILACHFSFYRSLEPLWQ
jgi:hypothetical protein